MQRIISAVLFLFLSSCAHMTPEERQREAAFIHAVGGSLRAFGQGLQQPIPYRPVSCYQYGNMVQCN